MENIEAVKALVNSAAVQIEALSELVKTAKAMLEKEEDNEYEEDDEVEGIWVETMGGVQTFVSDSLED